MRWVILFTYFAFSVTGCGHAWVVKQSDQGGLIGYKDFSSSKAATEAVLELVHCPDTYSRVSDSLIEEQPGLVHIPTEVTRNVYDANNRFIGQYTETNYTPVSINRDWRAFEYECGSQSRAIASTNCQESCWIAASRGELRKGVTVEQCIKLTCND